LHTALCASATLITLQQRLAAHLARQSTKAPTQTSAQADVSSDVSMDVANGHHRRSSSVTRRSPAVTARMQALELCFSAKAPPTPTATTTAKPTAATAAAVKPVAAAVSPRPLEVAATEPAEVEDEDAEQLATVGRPEYYGAVEPDTEDVASDVASDDDNNDAAAGYSDEEFDADEQQGDDVSTGGGDLPAADCAETEPAAAATVEKPLTGYDVLQARKAAAAAAVAAAAAAAAAASGESPKGRTGRRGSHLRAPSNIPTPTAQEAARYASELNRYAEVAFSGQGDKVVVLELGTDLVSAYCFFRSKSSSCVTLV
jgi:hypothetical protein